MGTTKKGKQWKGKRKDGFGYTGENVSWGQASLDTWKHMSRIKAQLPLPPLSSRHLSHRTAPGPL